MTNNLQFASSAAPRYQCVLSLVQQPGRDSDALQDPRQSPSDSNECNANDHYIH